ncbi:MAG: putative permease [Rhodobacteraceae bacterium HLUCCO18]|nr:MAG: putative permease [Rhodobacteraceae bacterium HLUCCO18]
MTAPVVAFFAVLVLCTSFIAGVFGMAGGMILMGGLLLILPVANAMVLHGITQLASNGWRAVLWRAHVRWRIVLRYAAGLLASAGLFSLVSFVPDQRLVFVFLGLVPFIPFLVPDRHVPRATARGGAESCGFICTSMQFVSGVSGPTLDLYFVNTDIGRRSIVATKACCQVVTHIAKIVYFGAVLTATEAEGLSMTVVAVAIAAAITGTTLARPVLERLSDHGFRNYTRYIIMAIGIVYLVKGASGYL